MEGVVSREAKIKTKGITDRQFLEVESKVWEKV